MLNLQRLALQLYLLLMFRNTFRMRIQNRYTFYYRLCCTMLNRIVRKHLGYIYSYRIIFPYLISPTDYGNDLGIDTANQRVAFYKDIIYNAHQESEIILLPPF